MNPLQRISTADAAERLGVSPRSVVMLIQKGQLPAERVGRGWWIDPADLTDIPRGRAGRPPQITRETWAEIDAAVAANDEPISHIAERFGIHESTIHRRRSRARRR